jgi:NDP-sugar pyrophosphorylase family protein
MQVVIPMAGSGSRFRAAGYNQPKPLLDVAGRPLIERLLSQFPKEWKFVFIPSQEHLQTTNIKNVLLNLVPSATILGIPGHKLGPVHTVLEALDGILDDIPTIVNYCDFSFSWDAQQFVDFTARTRCDGAILCYKGFHPHYLRHNLYAYCREKDGQILEVKEKECFTSDRTQEFASSGTYYFSSGREMKRYFKLAVEQNLSTNGEFYVSLVYNALIRDGKRALLYEIPFFLQWGTPEDLEDYVYWHRVFEIFSKWNPVFDTINPRLIMPMAGSGTRFEGFHQPKPLISVLGKPMYKTAQQYLPRSSKPEILVFQEMLRQEVEKQSPDATKVVLSAPTAGQADTTAQALSHVDPDEAVLVSACDHGVLWENNVWTSLLAKHPDVVVIGQRGYPGARRKPQQFSYIDATEEGHIRKVSVKKPLTSRPQAELVLVGTFYVAKAKLLQWGIQELIDRDIRVNGERYLDSVISIFLEKGLDVRCFEATGYLNWGSPEALAEFSYWYRYFMGTAA